MNPIWAIFFKDRFRTPFSIYKMSLAELAILVGMFVGVGYGIKAGVNWIIDLEGETISIDDK